jgi:hypothetical protein
VAERQALGIGQRLLELVGELVEAHGRGKSVSFDRNKRKSEAICGRFKSLHRSAPPN